MNSAPLPSSSSSPRPRWHHSAALKAQVLTQCQCPSASVTAVAQAHGLHASLVYQWRRDSRQALAADTLRPAAQAGGFIALPLPASDNCSNIEVELSQGKTVLKVRWPTSSASDCAAWLRGVLA